MPQGDGDDTTHSIPPSDALQFVVALSGRRFVLFLLVAALDSQNESPTGPALRELYKTVVGEHLSDGGFYSAMDGMAEIGVVEEQPINGRTAHWAVTDHGWRQLAAGYQWVGELLDVTDTIQAAHADASDAESESGGDTGRD